MWTRSRKTGSDILKITVVGANSYIARNLIFEIKQRQLGAELKLYDYAERQTTASKTIKK